MTQTQFTHRILVFDAITCFAMGGLLLAAATPLAGVLDISRAILFEAGLILIPFAAFVLWAAHRLGESTVPTRAVAWINLAWVAASAALCAIIAPNALGTTFVLAQASAVAALAVLQLKGIARIRFAV